MSGATADRRYGAPRAAPKRGIRPSWSDPRFRNIIYQAAILGSLALLIYLLVGNARAHLAALGAKTGFGFLGQTSGFQLSEKFIDYDGVVDTYGRALLVGILNTLMVSAIGIVLATVLGTLIGIGRLSRNWLVSKVTAVYVEVIRDIPVLLQLFVWSIVLQAALPGLDAFKAALRAGNVPWLWSPLPGVSLTQRGVRTPALVWQTAHMAAVVALAIGIVGVVLLSRRARLRQDATGVRPATWPFSVALILGLPIVVWAAMGAPFTLDMPMLGTSRFSQFTGGVNVSPEFFALLIGLVVYTSSYIAEIVRSGIQAVPKGQWEAAGAIGLSGGQALRQVVLPQALRVIVPPMTSQYLNLTKNTSLALAIGYADLMAVAKSTETNSGQSPEVVAVAMGFYLAVSLTISLFMNWYNARIALVER